jgi:hypothetical protein
MKRLVPPAALVFALACPAAGLAQSAPAGASPTVTFTFSNPALTPSDYTLLIHEDGTGRYRQPAVDAASSVDRPITVDASLRQQLFTAARKHHLFAAQCQAKHSRVAFTGQKTFQYNGPEGSGSCTFNYSTDEQLNDLADRLESVVVTLGYSGELTVLLAHDKLGLDAAVEKLAQAQKEGQALDLGNIAPVLQAIVADSGVLDHTRVLARSLLPQ